MNVNRKDLVRALESCAAGLSSKENIAQSNCYCFKGTTVYTYNGEILCQHDFPVPLHGAINAKPLSDLLNKLPEDEISVTSTEDKLRIKGANKKRCEIVINPTILLPLGEVESPEEWTEVPPAFTDAVDLVADNTSDDETKALAFVHFTKNRLEACDLMRAVRYSIQTGITSDSVLIRGSSCKALKSMGIAEVSETESWLHWKTHTGLRISARKGTHTYPDISSIFSAETIAQVDLPSTVGDILDRAMPFMEKYSAGGMSKMGNIKLAPGEISIRSLNKEGWYSESKEIEYNGPTLQFDASPRHIQDVLKYGLPCDITGTSIRIQGDEFVYALAVAGN